MGQDTKGKLFLLFCYFLFCKCDPFEYSECIQPKDLSGLDDDFFQFKVLGLKAEEYDFSNYSKSVFFAVNVASF